MTHTAPLGMSWCKHLTRDQLVLERACVPLSSGDGPLPKYFSDHSGKKLEEYGVGGAVSPQGRPHYLLKELTQKAFLFPRLTKQQASSASVQTHIKFLVLQRNRGPHMLDDRSITKDQDQLNVQRYPQPSACPALPHLSLTQ